MADIDMTDPAFKQLTPIIEQLRKRPDSRLLVAGGPPSLFTEEMRKLPRVEFWHSNEHSARQSSRTVPDRIDAIVFNKFLDHTLTNNLRNESRRRGIPMHAMPLGMSVIEGLIKTAGLDQATAGVIVADDASAEHAKPAYGAIRAFLAVEASFDVPSPSGEIDRLWALAQSRGLHTTRASISSAYFYLRKQASARPATTVETPNTPRMVEAKPAAPELMVVSEEPPAVIPAPADAVIGVTAPKPAVAPAIPKPSEVLQLLDDAIAGLQLARDAVKAIEPTLNEAEEARGLLAQMRKMLGVK